MCEQLVAERAEATSRPALESHYKYLSQEDNYNSDQFCTDFHTKKKNLKRKNKN